MSASLLPVRVALALRGDGPSPVRFDDALGEVSVGPQGLLSLVETRLGVNVEPAPFSRRLIQYLECLEECSEECSEAKAFYHASYTADPFATARTLLQWRDQWYLAGWRGSFTEASGAVPARLADMAAVERLAVQRVEANAGQRIQRVLQMLETKNAGIETIILHDHIDDFPYLWRSLVNALGAELVEDTVNKAVAPEGSDLHRLQKYLLADDPKPLDLQGDQSFVALRGASANDTAALVASHIGSIAAQGRELALLVEARGELLDEALQALHEPRAGYRKLSSARPLFQVLPLALEMLWSPLDVEYMLQFLSLPDSPVPRRARSKLMRCVAGSPGVGGEAWNAAIAQLLEGLEEAERERVTESIQSWLRPEQFAPETGAPFEVLVERCSRVLQWLLARRDAEHAASIRSYYSVAIGQVQEMIAALERLRDAGRAMLSRDNVLRLVDDVRGSGTAVADHQAELRTGTEPVLTAQHSGAFFRPVQELVWWDCQASDAVVRMPWSRAEREVLLAQGVQLHSEQAQLDWLGRAWLRPILCARERCSIVLHDDAERHHPVWDRLGAMVVRGMPVYSLSAQGVGAGGEAGDNAGDNELSSVAFENLSAQSLPLQQRWWQLPGDCEIPRRDCESYSSLAAFIYSPYEWLLQHAARIRRGFVELPSEGSLLRGNLVHKLIEQFFSSHTDIAAIDSKRMESWLDTSLPRLLEQQGATLLAAGRLAESAEFGARVREALRALVDHLQDAGVQSVQTEVREQAAFFGGQLRGFIDLVARCANGEEIIVDVKWGGRRYQRDNLREGNYLQLATYAFLRSAQRGGEANGSPRLSYFIASDAHMLSLDHGLFPNAEVIAGAEGESWASLWQGFETTWRWRDAQLRSGLIEITVEGTQADEQSEPPEGGLPVPEHNDQFSDYGSLTGWLRV